ncbi:MAG: replication-associated recombination protein A [Cyanobacteriota bacterium]
MSLFDILEDKTRDKPLADRIRPQNFESFIGQDKIVGKNSPLRRLIESNKLASLLFWGPPGCGKTTLARIIANITNSNFKELSAVTSGVKDLREIISFAKENLKYSGTKTILFIDEIHRYNKAQQDAILPHVENGTITLIGATTENPSFEIIPALRSRLRIIKLSKLSREDIKTVLLNSIKDTNNGLGKFNLSISEECIDFIITYSNGDARFALNLIEAAFNIVKLNEVENTDISIDLLKDLVQQASILYDKQSDEHFDHLSAYQKSLRGSDADAAIYWLAKMLSGGEDPRIICRRLVVTASEDVGNADPMAFVLAMNAYQALEKLGMPEARIPLSQATIYVAKAPKSNSSICAIDQAMSDIAEGKSYSVPIHLKDTHYKDARKYGHGVNYIYSHSNPDADQQFLPDELKDVKYYEPKHPEEKKRFNK